MKDYKEAWIYFKRYAPFNNPSVQERVYQCWFFIQELLSLPQKETLTTLWTRALNTGDARDFDSACDDIESGWYKEVKH